MHRFQPSIPSVLALCALVLAFSGTAVAARNFVITSTGQIKPSVLKKLKGPRGPQGPAGPAGPSNLASIVAVTGPEVTVPSGDAGLSIAFCPAGTRAISGGGTAITGQGNGLAASRASADRTSWFTIVGNTSINSGTTQAIVYCAGAGQAVASSTPSPAARARSAREAEAVAVKIKSALR